ncbi:7380_t:CDS:2, partial [Dentiscutata heterogama]
MSLDMLKELGTLLSFLNNISSYIGDYCLKPETITTDTSETIIIIADTINIVNNLYSGPGDPNDIINRD